MSVMNGSEIQRKFEDAYILEYSMYDYNRNGMFTKISECEYMDRELNIAFKWFKLGYYSKLD